MSEAEKFRLVAESSSFQANVPGPVAQRAKMILLAEHFEKTAAESAAAETQRANSLAA